MTDEDFKNKRRSSKLLTPDNHPNDKLKITNLELMGGKKGISENHFNVDIQAEEGFKGTIREFDNIIEHGFVEEILINNPYPNDFTFDELFKFIKNWLSPTGRIIINGTPNNKYVNKLKQQANIDQIGFEFNGLPLQPLHKKYRSHKYYKSDLESEIPPNKMKTTILKSSKGKDDDS